MNRSMRAILRHPEQAIRQRSHTLTDIPWAAWCGLGALSVGGSLVYGAGLGAALPGSAARRGAIRLTVASGASWFVLGPVSWLLLRRRGVSLWDVAQCCLVTMDYGIAVLLAGTPGNLVLAQTKRDAAVLPYNLAVIATSNVVMLGVFVRQLHALGVPRWQGALLWMLLLNGTGAVLFAALDVFAGAG